MDVDKHCRYKERHEQDATGQSAQVAIVGTFEQEAVVENECGADQGATEIRSVH